MLSDRYFAVRNRANGSGGADSLLSARVSACRYRTSEEFMQALHKQMQQNEVSPLKPFRGTISETDRIREYDD